VQASPTEALAWAIAPVAPALAADWEPAEPIASAAGISRVAAAATGMPSEGVPGDSMDRALAVTAVVAPPASDLAEAGLVVEEGEASEGEAGAGRACIAA
jgi:hypothetical protein